MKQFLCLFGIFALVAYIATSIVLSIQFGRNCEGRLERAANANNIHMAAAELAAANLYIEQNNLNEGYTSIFYTTPDEDLGYWSENLKNAQKDLDEMLEQNPPPSKLEESNQLIKLRETLLSHGDKGGEDVIAPSGVEVYPNNALFALWGWCSLIMAIIGGVWWWATTN